MTLNAPIAIYDCEFHPFLHCLEWLYAGVIDDAVLNDADEVFF